MVWQAQRTLDSTARAPLEARRFVGGCLAAWGLPDVDGRILLAVSELATNAVVHGSGPVDVAVDATSDRVRVTVGDHGRGTPALDSPSAETGKKGGWGLRLVDTVAEDWGTERQQERTIVWFEHALPSD